MTADFHLLAELPWSTPGVDDPIVTFAAGFTRIPGPPVQVRIVPGLFVDAAGNPWFLLHSGVVVRRVAKGWARLSLAPAELDGVVSLAPVSDGLIVLGRSGAEVVLTSLDNQGAVRWRRVGKADGATLDLPALRGRFDALFLDAGAVYLPGTRLAGQVARVDLVTGATDVVLDVGAWRGTSAGVASGALWRVVAMDGDHMLIRAPLDGSVPSSSLLEPAEAGRFDVIGLWSGGAVLRQDGALVRVGLHGEEEARVALRGMVRASGQAVVALDEGGRLVVHDGAQLIVVNPGAVPDGATLAAVDPDGLWFAHRVGSRPPVLYRVNRAGRAVAVEKTPDALDIEGHVDLSRALVRSDGAVLIPGADAKGAFVIEVR